ncbi:MAG: diaminobutyrate acetyltransferase [Woeseiaceae bacterium]
MFGHKLATRSADAGPVAYTLVFRRPKAADGPAVSGLIGDCPPLDENSRYCNLLQCSDFADTCVLVEDATGDGRRPLGWVSAYRRPREPQTLFVWQVAVHPDARGAALGRRMILSLLARQACSGVTAVKTTVTPDNHASRALFCKLAADLGAPMEERLHFDRQRHFEDRHESERLITIGPLRATAIARATNHRGPA